MPSEENDKDSHISESNKAAWDKLYASTAESVWGREPLPFLSEIAPILRSKISNSASLLDAATGEGRNIPYLLNLSNNVTACDASTHAIEKLPADLKTKITVHQCDLIATPFADDQFTLALMTDVIETLPNVDTVLKEIHRILKPEGYLVCNIPGKDDGIADDSMTPLGKDQFLYQEHYFYQFFTPSEATALLKRHGLNTIHSQECSWEEAPHPKFRENRHEHSSLILIAQKETAL